MKRKMRHSPFPEVVYNVIGNKLRIHFLKIHTTKAVHGNTEHKCLQDVYQVLRSPNVYFDYIIIQRRESFLTRKITIQLNKYIEYKTYQRIKTVFLHEDIYFCLSILCLQFWNVTVMLPDAKWFYFQASPCNHL